MQNFRIVFPRDKILPKWLTQSKSKIFSKMYYDVNSGSTFDIDTSGGKFEIYVLIDTLSFYSKQCENQLIP